MLKTAYYLPKLFFFLARILTKNKPIWIRNYQTGRVPNWLHLFLRSYHITSIYNAENNRLEMKTDENSECQNRKEHKGS